MDTQQFLNSFLKQVRRNIVALISLTVAVTSLSYSTWRNEATEHNRNQRQAGFEILIKLNELQLVIFHNRYDHALLDKGNPRIGWAHVLTVQDLSLLLKEPFPAKSATLLKVWNENWETMSQQQNSVDTILLQIEDVRAETLSMLSALK
ncbi:hypothetical protein [uncultured Paraglaciecola sp.]|uniref:hypothetical protein n=1 Tax=uncultured Paraglaciecola sp. TaxID=1765024 RepID=UPI0030DC692F